MKNFQFSKQSAIARRMRTRYDKRESGKGILDISICDFPSSPSYRPSQSQSLDTRLMTGFHISRSD